jgi:ERCC4-type nuclease
VDSHERYPWTFRHQQATTTRRALAAGDYAVTDRDEIVATVERKSLADLVSTLTTGRLRYLLADLAPRRPPLGRPRRVTLVRDDRPRRQHHSLRLTALRSTGEDCHRASA